MKTKIIISFVIFTLFSFNKILSQQTLTIDLSERSGEVNTYDVNVNTSFNVEIINRLPNEVYDVQIVRKASLLPVLNFPSINPPAMPMAIAPAVTRPCDAFLQIVDKVYSSMTKESDLPDIIQDLETEITKMQAGLGDPTCTANSITIGLKAIRDTQRVLPSSYTLKRGEELEVTITKKVAGGTPEVWKSVYTTPQRGQWITSYGFSFISRIFNERESFFSKPMDSAFVITQENTRSKLDFIPSVFFTWIPEKDLSKNFSLNLSAGLGFDLEAPVVFLGGSIFYNQNISLVFGLTAHQQEFLDGVYEENQVITESLTQDQLHEDLYTINPFFSLTYRFGSNIFNSNRTQTQTQN